MKTTALIVLMALLFPAAAGAEVMSLRITVDGLACPFCAYGVEKKLKRVSGVESMEIRMNEGTVTLTSGKGSSIEFKEVEGAVRDSGFTMREMTLTVRGTLTKEGGDFILLYGGPGDGLVLIGIDTELKERLTSYAKGGETVIVEGIASGMRGGTWSIKPVSIEEAAAGTTP